MTPPTVYNSFEYLLLINILPRAGLCPKQFFCCFFSKYNIFRFFESIVGRAFKKFKSFENLEKVLVCNSTFLRQFFLRLQFVMVNLLIHNSGKLHILSEDNPFSLFWQQDGNSSVIFTILSPCFKELVPGKSVDNQDETFQS